MGRVKGGNRFAPSMFLWLVQALVDLMYLSLESGTRPGSAPLTNIFGLVPTKYMLIEHIEYAKKAALGGAASSARHGITHQLIKPNESDLLRQRINRETKQSGYCRHSCWFEPGAAG